MRGSRAALNFPDTDYTADAFMKVSSIEFGPPDPSRSTMVFAVRANTVPYAI